MSQVSNIPYDELQVGQKAAAQALRQAVTQRAITAKVSAYE